MSRANARPALDPIALAGAAVTRALVPLWILSGALFKLFEGSPANLPVVVLRGVARLDLDPMLVLRYAIGMELALIGVMWLVPRLARPVAAGILILFLLVLVGDMLLGATSCGCFGAVRVHPAVTFGVDALLLAAVLVLGARAPGARAGSLPVVQGAAAVAWILAAFAAAFAASMGRPVVVTDPVPTPVAIAATPGPEEPNGEGATPAPAATPSPVATAPDGAGTPLSAATPTPTAPPAPTAAAVPAYYLPRYDSWLGRRWQDLEIAGWIRGAVDTGPGVRYVMFYRLDCPHCHELMELYFVGAPPQPTTLVAVPERTGWPDAAFELPCSGCGRAELPPADWLLATPVLVRLEDGVVACAAEVDAVEPMCLLR